MSATIHTCRLPAYALGETERRCARCGRWWRWVLDLREPVLVHGVWVPL